VYLVAPYLTAMIANQEKLHALNARTILRMLMEHASVKQTVLLLTAKSVSQETITNVLTVRMDIALMMPVDALSLHVLANSFSLEQSALAAQKLISLVATVKTVLISTVWPALLPFVLLA